MTWLDFVAVSEWPALVATGLAMFRRQIGSMLSRLGNGRSIAIPQLPKAAPLIEAAEEIAAERLTGEGRTTSSARAGGSPWQMAVDAEIKLLAESDEYPSEYCLLRSWGTLERLARLGDAALAKTQEKKHLTTAELVTALKLGSGDKALVTRLREIRNKVADGDLSVSPTDALRYRDLVVALLNVLASGGGTCTSEHDVGMNTAIV